MRLVLLLEWLMPRQGRLIPMKRDGKSIIARIPFTVEMLHEATNGRDFHEKLWAMQNRFGYHSISLPPAKIRVRLDYMVEKDTQLPVQDKGVVVDANGLANGHTYPIKQIVEHLFETLGKQFQIQIEGNCYEILASLRKVDVEPDPLLIVEKDKLSALYKGNKSKWLNERFESAFNPLRVATDPKENIVFILHMLWHMLSRIRRPKTLSIRTALRPMKLNPEMKLSGLPRFSEIKEPIEDALFMWTTESIPQQVEGHVSIAPQTRFGWCTENYIVVLDYRLDRVDSRLELLPSCHLIAIDIERGLGYLLTLEQLEDHITVDARFRIVDIRCPQHLSALLSLTNIRFGLPHQFNPEIEDNGLMRTVEAPLPYWMGTSSWARYEILNLSELYRTRFEFRLLPEDFDDTLKETVMMFYTSAWEGFKMRVRLSADDTEGTLVEIKHPAQAGTACINELEGIPIRSVSWLWIKWMVSSFRKKQTSPWHVLAWRFVECACRAGLKDYFSRHVWRVDKQSAAVLFGQRTLLAQRSGAVIPIIRYPYSLEKGYDADAVMNLSARMLGNRLEMTPDEYRKYVVDFDAQRFQVIFPASLSLLELMLEED